MATLKPLSDELKSQFHPTQNGLLDVNELSGGTSKNVTWLCPKYDNHIWDAPVNSRSQGRGCPYCANKKILQGFNDLASLNPKLAAEWHPTLNGALLPTEVAIMSQKSVFWLGKCGHHWDTVISNRSLGAGCLYCSGQKALKGFNDFETFYPELAAEWHPTKNGTLLASEVTTTSGKKVFWLGKCGHVFDIRVSHRSKRNHGCPECAEKLVGKKNATPKNGRDVTTTHPHLIAEWIVERNLPKLMSDYKSGSDTVAWWKCFKNHEWEAAIGTRSAGYGCNKCGSIETGIKRSTPEIGSSLADNFPNLIAEWHPMLNSEKLPTQVKSGSAFRVWWVCSKNHEPWQTTVYSRTGKIPSSCPTCCHNSYISKFEVEFYHELIGLGLTALQSNRKLLGNRREIDLYLPDFSLGVECNGIYYHNELWKKPAYHEDKFLLSQQKNIILLQIWEDEWNYKKEVVIKEVRKQIQLITQQLTMLSGYRIITISKSEAEKFIAIHSLQDYHAGNIFLGVQNTDSILHEVIVFSSLGKSLYQISNHVSLTHLYDHTEVLLEHFMQTYAPSQITVSVPNTSGYHQLYESHNFEIDSLLPPDYLWVKQGRRYEKESYTSEQAKGLANVNRIWDAGSTLYRKTVVPVL